MRCKRDSSASDRSIPFIPIIAKSLSKFPLAYSAIEFRPGARLERLERQGLQSVEGHVRTRVVSRLIKAGRAPLPFQSAANVRRIGRDTGHYSNRPPNFGRATPRIALGGAAIIIIVEGAVGPCHVLKPVITHAFTARIIPFWQVASHST